VRFKFIATVGFLVLFGLMPRASAATIFDTTGGTTFICCGGWAVSNIPGGSQQSIALRFNSASAVTVTDITAYLGSANGGSVDFGIMSNNGLTPSGTFLFHQTVSLGPSPINLSSLNWSISGGVDYWLTAIADLGTEVGWNFNDNLIGLLGFSHFVNGTEVWESGVNLFPKAIISSNEIVTPVPAALPLFATGLGALGLLGWRRKQRKAQPPSQNT
jgi:hypothetical protein